MGLFDISTEDISSTPVSKGGLFDIPIQDTSKVSLFDAPKPSVSDAVNTLPDNIGQQPQTANTFKFGLPSIDTTQPTPPTISKQIPIQNNDGSFNIKLDGTPIQAPELPSVTAGSTNIHPTGFDSIISEESKLPILKSKIDTQIPIIKSTLDQLNKEQQSFSDLQKQIDNAKTNLDTTNQNSVDTYNSLINLYNTKVPAFQAKVNSYNSNYNDLKNTINTYNTTIDNSNKPLPSELDSLGFLGKAVQDFTNTVINSSTNAGKQVLDFQKSLNNPNVDIQTKISKGLSTLFGGIGGMAFAGPSGVLKAGENIPVAGGLVKAFNYSVGKVGELAKYLIDKTPDEIIPKNLKPGLGDVSSFFAQAFFLHGLTTGGAKAFELATKDAITTFKAPKYVTINLRDAISKMSDTERSDFANTVIKFASESPENAQKVRDAFKISDANQKIAEQKGSTEPNKAPVGGINIKIPSEKTIYLVDKPYWAKIKSVLQFGAIKNPDVTIDSVNEKGGPIIDQEELKQLASQFKPKDEAQTTDVTTQEPTIRENLTVESTAKTPEISSKLAVNPELQAIAERVRGTGVKNLSVSENPNNSKIAPVQDAKTIGNKIVTTPALRTFDFNELEGKPQTPEANAKIHNQIVNNPDQPMSPKGESFNTAAKRGLGTVKQILDTPGNKVVTTHNSMYGLIKLWDEKGQPAVLNKSFREEYTKQDLHHKTGDSYVIKGENGAGDIYLVRHGETTDNAKKVFRTSQAQLTEKGIGEATAVGENLADKNITKVYTSDLPRAVHTSKLIVDEINKSVDNNKTYGNNTKGTTISGKSNNKQLRSGLEEDSGRAQRISGGSKTSLAYSGIGKVQRSELIARYYGEDGSGNKPSSGYTQATRLNEGEQVKIDEDTPGVLTVLGFPDVLINNFSLAVEASGLENLRFEDVIPGDFKNSPIGVYDSQKNALVLNPDALNHGTIKNGTIIFHEVYGGHKWYFDLAPEGRLALYTDMKNQVPMIKEAWELTNKNESESSHPFYWKQTLNQIGSEIENYLTTEEAHKIMESVGLHSDTNISLDAFIERSLRLDDTIKAINEKLKGLGIPALTIKAEDTWAIAEHNGIMAENNAELIPNNDSLNGRLIEDIQNRTVKFGKNGAHSLATMEEAGPAFRMESKLTSADPVINTKNELTVRDIAGNKITIPKDEAFTPYIREDGKILLQGEKSIVINKSTYDTVKANSKIASTGKEFAPELKQTTETVKSTGGRLTDDELIKLSKLTINRNRTPEEENLREQLASRGNIKKVEDNTKFSNYQLPGGTNYKEILIQAPTTEPVTTVNDIKSVIENSYGEWEVKLKDGTKFIYPDAASATEATNDFKRDLDNGRISIRKQVQNKNVFKSSHWEEPNVIAHIRMNDRTYTTPYSSKKGIEQQKVAFMEEMQSDWAREGRAKGFQQATQNPGSLLPEGWRATSLNGDTWHVVDENGIKVKSKLDDGLAYGGSKNVAIGKAIGDETLMGDFKPGVSNHSLLKNWQELAVKRFLQEAVNSGADRVAWTTGEQQQARYNLSQEVDNIEWLKSRPLSNYGLISDADRQTLIDISEKNGRLGFDSKGEAIRALITEPESYDLSPEDLKTVKDIQEKPTGKTISIRPKTGSSIDVGIDDTGKIIKADKKEWVGKNLADAIGKGLADKVLTDNTGKLSGEGLNIGGEWAKNLYDKQVPQIMEKLTGQKVENIDMGLPIDKNNRNQFERLGGSTPIKPEQLKVGLKIVDTHAKDFVITNVFGDGKFEAVPRDQLHLENTVGTSLIEDGTYKPIIIGNEKYYVARDNFTPQTFDISTKPTTQQSIKLTPEVKAIVKGEAPKIKEPMKQPQMAFRVSNKENLAPNGKKSDLTDEQYNIVRTSQFKNWFGDWENDPENSSKIVDENGEPLVVYHGSSSEKIEEFNPKFIGNRDSSWFGKGFYFALSKGEASTYGRNITDAFLNIKNPFDFSKYDFPGFRGYSLGDTYTLSKMSDDVKGLNNAIKGHIYGKGDESTDFKRIGEEITLGRYKKMVENENLTSKPVEFKNFRGDTEISYKYNDIYGKEQWYNTRSSRPIPNELLKYVLFDEKHGTDFGVGGLYGVERKIAENYGDQFTNELKELGYDGTIQSPDGDEYVAFKPNQIKSASNNTQFGETNNMFFRVSKKDEAKFDTGNKLEDAKKTLETVQKRVGVKSTNIDQLQNMLKREQMSLAAREAAPESHIKAYGEDRKPKYEAKIAELKDRIQKATPAPTIPPAPKIRVSNKDITIPEDLYHRQMAVEMAHENLANSPFGELLKYVAKSGEFEGQLPEVTGKSPSELKGLKSVGKIKNPDVLDFIKRGDQIIKEIFGSGETYATAPDVEQVRADMEKYMKQISLLKEEAKSVRTDIAEFIKTEKDRIATERIAQATDKEVEKAQIAKEKIDQKQQEAESLREWKNIVATYAHEASLPQSLDEVEPPKVRGDLQSPKLNFSKWKDIGVVRLGRDTFERNLEKVAPTSDANKLKKFIVDPVRENEFARTKFNNALKLKTKEKLNELGIKRNTLDDELIQKFGEGLISMEELQKLAPEKYKEIQEASAYFRKQYDALLDRWNAVRKEYGYPEIGKRKDYFRHFDEINFFTRTYGFLRKQDELPTEIAGKTEFFKPGKPFTTAELRRTGQATKYSAIGGFSNYIDSVSRQIFHINSIQRGRALEKYLEQSAKVAARIGSPLQLSNVIANIREYVNNGLAGKTATLDRAIESTVGRPMINAFQTISKLIGKNIIVGNISTALSHLVSLPLIAATTDKLPLMKGMMTTLTSPLMNEPFTMIDGQESSFLTRRFPVEEIMPTIPKTIEKALSYFFIVTDKFKSRLAVSAKYYEGIKNGLDPKEAMHNADIYAGKVLGDYSLGQKPNIMNAKMTTLLAQFQLGLNDSISVLVHDIPRESTNETIEEETGEPIKKTNNWKLMSKLIQFAIFSYLFNILLKQIRGSGKGIDPIDLGMTIAGVNEEGVNKPILSRLGLAGTDLLGELPFSSIFTGNFPLATAFSGPIGKIKSGNYKGAAEDLLAEFASPVGGGLQAKKTYEGLKAYQQGFISSKTGIPQFGVVKSGWSLLQNVIFGPSSTAAAQAYYSSIGKPSQAKATFDEIQQLLKEGKKAEATAITNAMTAKEYGTYKAEKTRLAETEFIPQANKILQLLKDGKTAEASKITGAMTPEQYKIYKGAKGMILKAQARSTTNNNNGIATFEGHATRLPESKPLSSSTFTQINPDDGNIASLNKNGEPIYARDVQLEASRRKQLIAQDPYWNIKASQFDHIIPLGAGGTNTADNVQLISKEADQGNQPFENYIVGLYKTGGISRADALKASIDYKINKTVSLDDVINGKY